MGTIKEADCVRDESTGGSRSCRSREEVNHSQRDGTLVVKHGEVDEEAREEARLEDPEKETACDEGVFVVAEGRERCYQASCKSDTTQPSCRLHALQ
jgi:hypothetical protein